MIIRNEDVRELIADIPEGHRHLRTTMVLEDGTELIFQEATIANLLRAYITVKTHPTVKRVHLRRQRLAEKKEGYAEWQLLDSIE